MEVTKLERDLLGARTSTVIALVGASNDRSKYGNIIFRDLARKGFKVIPVNPREKEILGVSCFPTLESAASVHSIGIANFVIPPERGHEAVRALRGTEARSIWFQPGAFDSQLVALARTKFASVVAGPCIMVET